MPLTHEELVVDLSERFERVERAILGDHEVGHKGAIERLNTIDAKWESMETKRVEGDRRAHQRIDEFSEELSRVEKKIDRLWWMLLGSSGAGFAIGWGISGAPLPGG